MLTTNPSSSFPPACPICFSCSDFDGRSKQSSANLHVYASVYGSRCVEIGAQFMPVAGFQEVYVNNSCILGVDSGQVMNLPFQDAFPPHATVANASEFQARFVSGGNTIYVTGTPKGLGPFKNFSAFLESGYEIAPSTVVSTLPTPAEIVAMGKALLMPAQ